MLRAILLIVLSCQVLFGQHTHWNCGQTQKQEGVLRSNPKFQLLHQQAQAQLAKDRANYMADKNEMREEIIYTIPVIFHVLHNGDPEKNFCSSVQKRD